MSIDPELWGPPVWSTLHFVAAGFPEVPSAEDRKNYKAFFENLKYTLPCPECRQHYTELLKEMPLDPFLISGKHLRQWLTTLHNTVNEKTLENPASAEKWTLEQVDAKYPVPETPRVPPRNPPIPVPQLNPPLPVPKLNPPLPVPQLNRVAKVTLQIPNFKSASVSFAPISWAKKQQLIARNNARSMGRIMFRMSGNSLNPLSKKRVLSAAPPTAAVFQSVAPPAKKKKGCGCKKK
jgi:hypothetical protein